jgi:hypothetical protein
VFPATLIELRIINHALGRASLGTQAKLAQWVTHKEHKTYTLHSGSLINSIKHKPCTKFMKLSCVLKFDSRQTVTEAGNE